ncbi:TIGR04255 family protein [Streptomyces sp. 21So2-11]|uniref:TIGR04255 family protein n=1 Tax=Streptomyces sp. 21So2-11 TaxID=3144408 RepID=UPI00321961D1
MDTAERGALFEHELVDVPLTEAPLARVIGQLRFGTLSVLASDDGAAQSFIKALAEEYPYVEQGLEQALFFAPGQPVKPTDVGKVWRLRSANQQSVVALTNGALTLETASYPGRRAFCGELARLAGLLQTITRVPSYNRVAVRYSNRLVGEETLEQLPKLVHSELLGLVGAPLANGVRLAYTLSQALLEVGDGAKLLAQFGRLPESSTFDASLPAVPEPSWVLDLDSYEEYPDPRAALPAREDSVSAAANVCAERAHTFFRWAVTKEFLSHFGGEV